MPVNYTNFRGQKYYLHKGKAKKSGSQYFFSMKQDGEVAESIPEGYEIYETPNGQVFLRKIWSAPLRLE